MQDDRTVKKEYKGGEGDRRGREERRLGGDGDGEREWRTRRGASAASPDPH